MQSTDAHVDAVVLAVPKDAQIQGHSVNNQVALSSTTCLSFPTATDPSHSPLQRRSSTKASSHSSSSSAASTPPPSTPPTPSFLPLNLCINPKEQLPQPHNQLRQATIQNLPHHHQATISHEPKCSHKKFAYGCTRCPGLRR